MKGMILGLALASAFVATSAHDAAAQYRDRSFGYHGWGPRVGLAIDADQVVGGAHFDFGELFPQVRMQPNAELGFGDDARTLEINVPLHFRFAESFDVWSPYAGAELGWILAWLDDVDDQSDLGLKIVGGFERHISSGDKFFLEARVAVAGDYTHDWKFIAGWTFYQ